MEFLPEEGQNHKISLLSVLNWALILLLHTTVFVFLPAAAGEGGGCDWQKKKLDATLFSRELAASSAFQSSSGPKTGCNVFDSGDDSLWVLVSILIRSEDRMQLLPAAQFLNA